MDLAVTHPATLIPPRLKHGDKVRFLSPASTPDREQVMRRTKILENWGLRVDFGEHAFDKMSFLAGTDDDRLSDFNAALNDPDVRAILATRGGKGSYRIADRLDFEAARRDPKFVVGFSDITALLVALDRNCGLVGIHGSVIDEADVHPTNMALRRLFMEGGDTLLAARWEEMQIGQVDRQFTMLRKAGHLDGVAGIAVGQFTGFKPSSGGLTVIDLLRDHLQRLGVPILGGLPVGHGEGWLPVPHGAQARLDASTGTLTVPWPAPPAV